MLLSFNEHIILSYREVYPLMCWYSSSVNHWHNNNFFKFPSICLWCNLCFVLIVISPTVTFVSFIFVDFFLAYACTKFCPSHNIFPYNCVMCLFARLCLHYKNIFRYLSYHSSVMRCVCLYFHNVLHLSCHFHNHCHCFLTMCALHMCVVKSVCLSVI